MYKLTNYSWYIHNHIHGVISFWSFSCQIWLDKLKKNKSEDRCMANAFGSVCILTHVFPSNYWLDHLVNYIIKCTNIINLICMYFLLYINVIISYSFRVCKNVSVVETSLVIAAILEITQDALCIVITLVQTLHFNGFFILLLHRFKFWKCSQQ